MSSHFRPIFALMAAMPFLVVACQRTTEGLSGSLAITAQQGSSSSSSGGESGSSSSSSSSSSSGASVSAPEVITFSLSSTSVASGAAVTLTWAVRYVTSATLLQAPSTTSVVGNAGSMVINPTETTTFGLTAVNAGGTAAAVATVYVGAPPAPTLPGISSAVTPIGPADPTNLPSALKSLPSDTVTVTGQNLSTTGNNTVLTDCQYGGVTPSQSAAKASDAPDGSGNVVIVEDLAIPSSASACSFLVVRPDGVGALPVVLEPYWAVLDRTVVFSSPHQVDQDGKFWYAPTYDPVTMTVTPSPTYAPLTPGESALVQFFYSASSAAGGQALFQYDGDNTSGSSNSSGNVIVQIGGCGIGDQQLGASDVYIFIGNHMGEEYLPVAANGTDSCG